MKLITRQTDYAVRSLAYLAGEKNRFVPSARIAKELDIPLIFLRRILQVLTLQGIVASREGINGGVKLIKNPAQITFDELFKIFEGDALVSECINDTEACKNTSSCLLRKRLIYLKDKIRSELQKITLESVLEKKSR